MIEDNQQKLLEAAESVPSAKYPDLLVKHEILLDWIIYFATMHGRMPTLVECKTGYATPGYASEDSSAVHYITTLVKALYELHYLVPEGGVVSLREDFSSKGKKRTTSGHMRWIQIAGIGARIREPVVSVLFGRVYVSPCPHGGLQPEEAMALAWKIDRYSRMAEVDDGRLTKPSRAQLVILQYIADELGPCYLQDRWRSNRIQCLDVMIRKGLIDTEYKITKRGKEALEKWNINQ